MSKNIEIDSEPSRVARKSVHYMRLNMGWLIPIGVSALVLLIGWPIVSVPAGHTAVVDFYGHAFHSTLRSGVQFKMPFAHIYMFSLKTQLLEVDLNVPTNEGLVVSVDASVLYHIKHTAVRDIYTTVGIQFTDVLLKPEVHSTIRSLTSRVAAKALYSAGRDELSDGITKQLNEKLNPRGIEVEQILLRKVVLPPLVTTAIEEKLKAEQESQRMEFILTKEKQEAERKRIEAQGIADFQKIVSQGISPQLLEWKGIEATEKLAASRNTKVIVVGSQKNGLPLILGDHQTSSEA
ncbi:hypothetical protein CEUSTIGMA_g1840.t1 [Chlamydomonas eustigma]|uniref:Prohibitin n=1 Tax=Chlamydomonas eustigma TaxID=1157962 RepID=A0A250WUT1_9CHLO|nr:hypothetical protein CEUSTIGMA_g1840.t1 [Chlamydomonas eustigma]|eukprot:GAX74392.1 hypothetical protein CEUSTIGMA_g1840.t1 [Chlamydomonas eustigma]